MNTTIQRTTSSQQGCSKDHRHNQFMENFGKLVTIWWCLHDDRLLAASGNLVFNVQRRVLVLGPKTMVGCNNVLYGFIWVHTEATGTCIPLATTFFHFPYAPTIFLPLLARPCPPSPETKQFNCLKYGD